MKRIFLILFSIFIYSFPLFGQKMEWQEVSKASYYRSFQLKDSMELIENATISLPLPNGSVKEFTLMQSELLDPELAAKFPEIQVFNAIGITDNIETARINKGVDGLHAQIFTPEGIAYLDPDQGQFYKSFYSKDFFAVHKRTPFADEVLVPKNTQPAFRIATISDTDLKTYRLAVSATGEFTQFHGGTVIDGLNTIVTIMNRVAGIYIREIGVTFQLVADNDLIIYTDGANDPFTNDDAAQLIDENQIVLDQVLGNLAYDVGHNFSTGGGGLAALGSVCNSAFKAMGITGLPSPVGDLFAVDYVAHEIGHQFGATHTFNGINGACAGGTRTAQTAYEPGSGSTIMAYAGICGDDNIQNRSDPYFHAASLEQMYNYIQSAGTCFSGTTLSNQPPVIISSSQDGLTLPIGTPFILKAEATDPDGDVLTYSWEQYDLGPALALSSPPSENAPVFRSMVPDISGKRVFGLIENLPDYNRAYTFRLTVRDNSSEVGIFNNEIIKSYNLTDLAGPFSILSDSLSRGNLQEIVWDAANTNLNPVNCQSVRILYSSDGQNFLPFIANTSNDGRQAIQVPNLTLDSILIRIESADHIFYTEKFIKLYDMPLTSSRFIPLDIPMETCADSDIFSFFVDVPTGNTVEFALQSPTISIEPATFLIDQTDTVAIEFSGLSQGDNLFSVLKSDATDSLVFSIKNKSLSTPKLSYPKDAFYSSTDSILFEWAGNPDVQGTISVFKSDNTIIYKSESTNQNKLSLPPGILPDGNIYFWNISQENNCGAVTAQVNEIFSIGKASCNEFISNTTPVTIIDEQSVSSSIQIDSIADGASLSALQLTLQHSWLSDLQISLTEPTGNQVLLFDRNCDLIGRENPFTMIFNPNGSAENCPPAAEGALLPVEPFNSLPSPSTGEWQLSILDNEAFDSGTLTDWRIYFCKDIVFDVTLMEVMLDKAEIELNNLLVGGSGVELLIASSSTQETIPVTFIGKEIITIDNLMPDTDYEIRVGGSQNEKTFNSDILRFKTKPIVNNEQQAILFYPNPAQDLLYFTKEAAIQLYDIRSVLLLNQKVTPLNPVDISSLKAGVYFIKSGEHVTKLLIE